MRKFFLWVCLGASLAGLGCVSEATRRLNYQNYQAGSVIENGSSDPVIKQAGADVAANAAEVGNDIGAPRVVPPKYSPEISASLRADAQKVRENRWNLLSSLTGFATSPFTWTGLIGLIATGLGWVAKQRGAMNKSMSDGLEAVKELIPEAKQTVMQEKLRRAARKHNILDAQRRFYQRRIK